VRIANESPRARQQGIRSLEKYEKPGILFVLDFLYLEKSENSHGILLKLAKFKKKVSL